MVHFIKFEKAKAHLVTEKARAAIVADMAARGHAITKEEVASQCSIDRGGPVIVGRPWMAAGRMRREHELLRKFDRVAALRR